MGDGSKRSSVALIIGLAVVLVFAVAAVVLSVVILIKVNDNTAATSPPATTPAGPTPTTTSAGPTPATTPTGPTSTTTPAGPTPATTSTGTTPATTPAGTTPATTPAGTTPATTSAGPTLRPPDVGNSSLYADIAAHMSKYINFNVDPCTDFYQYACGNFNETSSAFGNLASSQGDLLVQAINAVQDGITSPTNSMSLRMAQRAFKSCLGDQAATSVSSNVATLVTYLPHNMWPMLSTAQAPAQIDPSELWRSVAQLSTVWMTNTFITPYAPPSDSNAPIDTNWKAPLSNQPHLLYLDQATLYLGGKASYTSQVWPLNSQSYIANLNSTIHHLAPFFNYAIQEDVLTNDINQIIALEIALASISKADDQRRNFTLMYNLNTFSSAALQFPNVNWSVYFQQFTMDATSLPADFFTSNQHQFVVVEPDFISQLNGVLSNFTARTIINYLGWRLMDQFTQFLPAAARNYFEFRRQLNKDYLDREVSDDAAGQARSCAGQLTEHVPFVSGRLLVDVTFKGDAAAMSAFQSGVSDMIRGILNGFRSMLSELPWMHPETLNPAYNKISQLAINPGWPAWQQDDALLDQVYITNGLFNIVSGQDWFTTYKTLLKVHTRLNYNLLLATAVDRNFFEMSPALVNAWYQPERNSISFPLAILNPPFYSAEYPTALNLGGLGMVIGHELTHGFDDEGVQWDSIGTLAPWLDPLSLVGFNKMATCIQTQYSKFCPSSTQPVCVNGVQTQGENIADNGGIRAAFRAYKSIQSLNGQDPRLPGQMSQFSQDQLFFLSFAQVWCGRPRDPVHDPALQRQLLTDAHSPAIYRVLGTAANFPQFAAAYNCPVPNPHCNIWVGDN